MNKPVVNSMFCDPLESDELVQLISNLNPNKSPGPDDIHPKITRDVTCKGVSAKHSVEDDFALLWEQAIFRHPLNENPLTDRSEILHS
jgi:hypothetical protein